MKLFKPAFLIYSLLLLCSCRPGYILHEEQHQNYRFDPSVTMTDPGIDSLILPYKNSLDEAMNEVVGFFEVGLTKGKPESTLGNWVADALMEESAYMGLDPPDFAIQNYGGLRISEIPRGPVQLGKIYELMPFENYLVLLRIKGAELEPLFNRLIDYGGWPVSAELRITSKGKTLEEVYIDGNSLELRKEYLIAMPDYVANGGDDCWFFKDKARIETGILIRDLLITNLKRKSQQGIPAAAYLDDRFRMLD